MEQARAGVQVPVVFPRRQEAVGLVLLAPAPACPPTRPSTLRLSRWQMLPGIWPCWSPDTRLWVYKSCKIYQEAAVFRTGHDWICARNCGAVLNRLSKAWVSGLLGVRLSSFFVILSLFLTRISGYYYGWSVTGKASLELIESRKVKDMSGSSLYPLTVSFGHLPPSTYETLTRVS